MARLLLSIRSGGSRGGGSGGSVEKWLEVDAPVDGKNAGVTAASAATVVTSGVDVLGFPVPDEDLGLHAAASRLDELMADARAAAAAGSLRDVGAARGPAADRLMALGLGHEARSEVWAAVLGVPAKKAAASAGYAELVELGSTSEDLREARDTVDKDVRRTFPAHPRFQDPPPQGCTSLLPSLRRLLLAVCARHRDGYCQGLNFLAGFLLLIHLPPALPSAPAVANLRAGHASGSSCILQDMAAAAALLGEENAFWILTCLIEEVLCGFYGRSLDGTRVEVAVLDSVVATAMPAIHQHLGEVGATMPIIAVRWLMVAFTTVLPSATLLHLWDLLVFRGLDVLVHACVAIVAAAGTELCLCRNPSACSELLQDHARRMYDRQSFIDEILHRMRGACDVGLRFAPDRRQREEEVASKLQALRRHHGELVAREDRQVQQRRALQTSFRNLDADRSGSLDRQEFSALISTVLAGDVGVENQETFTPGLSSSDGNSGGANAGALLSALFDFIDQDGDGVISFSEFMSAGRLHPRLLSGMRVGMAVLHGSTPSERLRHLFDQFDSNRNGSLDEQELLALVSSIYSAVDPQQDSAASESGGLVGMATELHTFLAQLLGGETPAATPPDKWKPRKCWQVEAAEILRLADANGDGVITFEEFRFAASTMPVLLLGTSLLSTPAEREDAHVLREVGSFSATLEKAVSCWAVFRPSTHYVIKVEADHLLRAARVERVYSDFLTLHDRLAAIAGSPAARLPPMPTETIAQLRSYLKAVEQLPDLAAQAALREWLGLPFRRELKKG